MKRTAYIRTIVFMALFAGLTGSSCKKSFIDLYPISQGTADHFYTSETDFVNAINASYSVLQRVSYLPGLSGLRLSPNPTTSQLWLDLSQAPAGTLLVNVLDDQGRTIRKWVFQNQFNYWREAIDVANLAPGSYILQLAGQGTQTSKVFIKQ